VRWVALRLLDGDPSIVEAVRSGTLAHDQLPQVPTLTQEAPLPEAIAV
jgi:hypothetical protein